MNLIETGLSPGVLALLDENGLPSTDLREGRQATLLAAVVDKELLGCVGYELSGNVGLLRSLAVQAVARGKGLGRQLVAAAEWHAREAGASGMFLLTTTAAPFFEQLGYQPIRRDLAPAFISGSTQFQGLCPASAVLMVRQLSEDA